MRIIVFAGLLLDCNVRKVFPLFAVFVLPVALLQSPINASDATEGMRGLRT